MTLKELMNRTNDEHEEERWIGALAAIVISAKFFLNITHREAACTFAAVITEAIEEGEPTNIHTYERMQILLTKLKQRYDEDRIVQHCDPTIENLFSSVDTHEKEKNETEKRQRKGSKRFAI